MDITETFGKLVNQIRHCKKCGLYKSSKRAVPGEGPVNAKIVFVGLAPGKEEDRTGRPFTGRAGKFFDKILKKNKIDRKRVFITSTVKHHPPKNRIPRKEEINACFPYTIEQILIIKPRIVVLLGNVAKETFLNNAFLKEKRIKIFSTYHPAAAMRFPTIKKRLEQDFRKIRYYS